MREMKKGEYIFWRISLVSKDIDLGLFIIQDAILIIPKEKLL